MQHFIDVYGDTMQQKHRDCQNCCVLIQAGDASQCGIILTCGDSFCYVLTTKRSMLRGATMDFVVTFGDEIERNFGADNVVVQSGNELSIFYLHNGNETIQAKQPVHFSTQDNIEEEAVVYTLSYVPKTTHEGRVIQPANSYLRGGNAGIIDLQHEGLDIFYHNCCAGIDIINGSAVLNQKCEVIGMNLEHSTGWTMALRLSAIKEELAGIFPDTQDMTFADIQDYLEAKGEVEANRAKI